MLNGHGDDRYQFSQTITADFSSNVWFEGPQPALLEHLQQRMATIGNYPEPDAGTLRRKIARNHKVGLEQVLTFNGSVDAFYTLALAFQSARSAILIPGFAEYEDACRLHNHRLSFFRENEIQEALSQKPDLCWIGNPNNPDGHVFSFQELAQFISGNQHTVLVIDEAYAELFPDFEPMIPFTKNLPNLVVVRSLTKSFAIPGLRLGYTIASPGISARLARFQQPWAVNSLAQEAGCFILGHWNQLAPDARQIQQLSKELQMAVQQIPGFRVCPSNGSFFLIEMIGHPASQLKQFLIEKHGLLIRDAGNFRGMTENFFRISAQSPENNQRLVAALNDWNQKHPL